MIRNISIKDASQVCDIYNYYVINTRVTFEEKAVTENEMEKRIEQVTSKFPWLVYEENKELMGYAYSTEWKARSSYRFSAETTVYLKPQYCGKGIGSLLYKSLIDQMKSLGIHSLIGGIALPNNSSIALHEKLNFKKVAHFQQVGFKMNQWVDVAYWQLLLETENI